MSKRASEVSIGWQCGKFCCFFLGFGVLLGYCDRWIFDLL